MTSEIITTFCDEMWEKQCLPKLAEYICIPCQSPAYDKEWATNGLLEEAMSLMHRWVLQQDIPGMTAEMLQEPGKTPFLFIQIPPSRADFTHRILMYGHMDKQPPLLPWAEGLGPYTPVIRDGKLYGRAGAGCVCRHFYFQFMFLLLG